MIYPAINLFHPEMSEIVQNKIMRVVLFALTGFGNTVLKALLKDPRVEVEAVFTTKYDHPFPYYQERQLIELCSERGINCHFGVSVCGDQGMDLLRKYQPDLILVATFKQILKENVLRLPELGVVNFHPSLLPRYRGPCPTNAVLLNHERITGVTIHYVTEKLDDGDILQQRSITINETDNDGRLRQKLAKLAAEMVPELVEMFAGFNKPVGTPQDEHVACYAPKPTLEDGYLESEFDIQKIQRKIRAFNPLPGTSILVRDRRIPVDRFELIECDHTDGYYETSDTVEVFLETQAISLHKKIVGSYI